MSAGGRVTRTYTGPDGRLRIDVEDDDGETRSGLTVEDLVEAAVDDGASKAAGQPNDVKFFQYELEGGVVTINELRASKGLPSDPRFGAMTLPEYIAANAHTYKVATLARTAGAYEGLAATEGGTA